MDATDSPYHYGFNTFLVVKSFIKNSANATRVDLNLNPIISSHQRPKLKSDSHLRLFQIEQMPEKTIFTTGDGQLGCIRFEFGEKKVL